VLGIIYTGFGLVIAFIEYFKNFKIQFLSQEIHKAPSLQNHVVKDVLENITVYSRNYTTHINMFCGQSKEFLHVKADNTHSNHHVLNR
jgi:hypothetical protein